MIIESSWSDGIYQNVIEALPKWTFLTQCQGLNS